jgi:hypothetical protein
MIPVKDLSNCYCCVRCLAVSPYGCDGHGDENGKCTNCAYTDVTSEINALERKLAALKKAQESLHDQRRREAKAARAAKGV